MIKTSILLAALTAMQGTSAQQIQELINSVCYPSGQLTVRDTQYPCPLLERTMTTCKANGTTPAHLKAHRDCICEGSYIDDEFGCLDCLWTHGFRGNQDRKHWRGVLSSASAAFCVPTPTADWPKVWASVSAATPYASATVDNELSNKAVGNTQVEIYYNATRLPQGPGPFTPVPPAATVVTTAVSTEPSRPALGINDGVIRYSGKAEVANTTAIAKPSGAKFDNSTMSAGTPGGNVYVTIVQIFVTQCCAVRNADGDYKLSCDADKAIPGTIDNKPTKEKLATLPVFHVDSNGQSKPNGNGMSPAPGAVIGSGHEDCAPDCAHGSDKECVVPHPEDCAHAGKECVVPHPEDCAHGSDHECVVPQAPKGSPGAPKSPQKSGSPGAPHSGSGSGPKTGAPGSPHQPSGVPHPTGVPGASGNAPNGGRPVTVSGAVQAGMSVSAVLAAVAVLVAM